MITSVLKRIHLVVSLYNLIFNNGHVQQMLTGSPKIQQSAVLSWYILVPLGKASDNRAGCEFLIKR